MKRRNRTVRKRRVKQEVKVVGIVLAVVLLLFLVRLIGTGLTGYSTYGVEPVVEDTVIIGGDDADEAINETAVDDTVVIEDETAEDNADGEIIGDSTVESDTAGGVYGVSSYGTLDAATAPSIEYESLTPANATSTTNASVELNVSIYGAADLSEFTWNWNGSNYTVYNDSLILMLNFDNLTAVGDNATTAVDASRYSNNGTLFNGTTWNVTGKYGSAVQLDGVDDIVELYTAENSFDMRQNITITAWINPDVVGDYDMLLTKWDNINGEKSFYLATFANGSINFVYSADGTNGVNYPSRGSVTAGKWSFVAYTYNGTTQTFYLDGNYDTSRLKSYVVFNSPAAIRVGGPDDDDYCFDGKVDEVMIWNSTLTSGEIRQLYLSNLRKYDDDGNWAFYANESINQSTKNYGPYTYFASVQDTSGNANRTDVRQILSGDYVSPSVEFQSLTPTNATTTTNASVEINISIYNAADLGEFTWNWNETNYTMFNDSLILMLNFDNNTEIGENATYAVDASKYSSNGTFGNATANNLARPNWTASGKYGPGVLFDGKDDYISIPDSNNMDLKSTWTISFWANIVGFGNAVNYVGVITKYDGTGNSWELIENVGAWNDSIYFTGTFGGIWEGSVGTGHLQKNTWYHLVWTFNSSNATNCYQDGTLVSSSGKHSGSLTPVNTVPITIGGGYDNTKLFNGSMDEVIIWNRSLTALEVRQLYYSNLKKYDTDKWSFYVNETTDGINHTYSAHAQDTSGNANGTDIDQLFYGAADAPNIAPSIPTINEPANNTNFTVQTFLINVTLTDADSGTLTTRIYAGNESDGANKLVFYNTTGVNDYNFTYNLTALPLSASPDDGMVMLLHLDNLAADGENATYAYDYSFNGNTGEFGNDTAATRPTWTTAGKFGSAASFDGGDFIDAGSVHFTSTASISFWYKYVGGALIVTDKDNGDWSSDGFRIYMDGGGGMEIDSSGGDYGAASTTINSEWHHMAVIFNGALMNVYVDGKDVTTDSSVSSLTPGASNLIIGRHNNDNYWFTGTLDEIAMWNRSLTLQEVHNLYRLGYGKYYFKVNTTDSSVGNETDVKQVGIQACGTALTADMSLNSNTERCPDTAFTIASNNLFLDCQGYTITGSNTSASDGINATEYDNVTIKNCIIKDFEDGISFRDMNNSLISNVTIYSSNETGPTTGINFSSAHDTSLINNRLYNVYAETKNSTSSIGSGTSGSIFIKGNNQTLINCTGMSRTGVGIYIQKNSTVINSSGISDIEVGIYVANAQNKLDQVYGNSTAQTGISLNSNAVNTTLSNSTAESRTGFGIDAASYSTYLNNTFISNTNSALSDANNYGSYSVYDSNNMSSPTTTTNVAVISGTYNKLYNNTIYGAGTSLSVSGTYTTLDNNVVYTSTTSTTTYAISIGTGQYNILRNNIGNGTKGNVGKGGGITVTSSNTTLTNNTGYVNGTGVAINIATGQNNSLYSNTGLSKNGYGISVTSQKNNLTNNLAISYNNNGLYVNSHNNTLENNTAYTNSSNMYGIYLDSSSAQTVARNNIGNGTRCGTGSTAGGGIVSYGANTLLIGNSGFGANGSVGLYIIGANTISINNTGYGQDDRALYIISTATNFSSLNDVAYTKGASTYSSGAAISISGSKNCIFNGTNATGKAYGIHFSGSGANITIANAVISGQIADIDYQSDTVMSNVTCINCTLSRNKVMFNATDSNMTLAEYVRVNITNASGDSAVYLANVSFTDSFSALKDSQLAGTNGLTQWARLDTYFKNYTATINYINYTMLATALSHGDSTATVNISQDKQYHVTLNKIPTTPALITFNDSSFIQEIINLNWTNSTDLDSSTITYRLEVANISTFNAANLVIINSSIAESINTSNATLSFDVSATYYWRVLATDSIANSSWSEIRQFTVQLNVAPNVTLIYPMNGSYLKTSNIAFNITVDDADLNSLTVDFVVNGSVVNETFSNASGYNTLNYTLSFNDGFQNWSANVTDGTDKNQSETRFFTIDTVIPVLTYNTSTAANNTYSNASNIIANVSISEQYMDNLTFELFTSSAVTNTTVKFNDNSPSSNYNYSINYNITPDGLYYYNVSMYDRAGNYNATDARAMTIDRTIPVLAYNTSTAANNSVVEQNYIFVNVSIAEINLANMTFRLYNQTALVNSTMYTGSNRSINWSVSNANALYTYNITVYDLAGNINQADTRTIILDSTMPTILITAPANGTSYATLSTVTINYTITDTNIASCWYQLGNFTNVTMDCDDVGFSNGTTIKGWNNFTIYANDSAGHESKSAAASFLIDNVPDIPTLIIPENDTQKLLSNITFLFNSNDSDGDAVTYNIMIANDSGFSSMVDERYVTSNTSYSNLTLPQGTLYWKVRANDSVAYSNFSSVNVLDYVVPRLAVYSPANNTVIYPAQTIAIYANETERYDWITNVTIAVTGDGVNSNYTPVNLTSGINTTWNYNYTVPNTLTPSILTILLKGYNGSDENVNASSLLLVTRSVGAAVSAPTIAKFLTDPTYITQNSSTNISLYIVTDTVLSSVNTSIVLPNGTDMDLSYIGYSKNNLNYTYNYTFNATDNYGNYTLSALVTDANNQQASDSRSFFVNQNVTITIQTSGVNTTSIKDISSKRVLLSGDSIADGLPRGKYDVEFDVSLMPRMTVENATLNETVTGSFNYSNLDESLGPTDTRTIDRFQLTNNLQNTRVNITYNYSLNIGTITNENNLKFYKCTSVTNCTWSEITTALDEDTNMASAVFSNFSVFGLSESVVTTTVTTTTVAGGGSSGVKGGSVFYDMSIITPMPVGLGLNSRVVVPLSIRNNGQIGLSSIKLTLIPNSTSIKAESSIGSIPYLDVNRDTLADVILQTGNETGRFQVAVKAESTNPSFTEIAYIYINAGVGAESNRTIIVEKILFVKDLFKENPECLELNEIIEQAEDALNAGRIDKAVALTETAINACRDLVASKGKVMRIPGKAPYTRKQILIGAAMLTMTVAAIVSLIWLIKSRKKAPRRVQREIFRNVRRR